MSEAGRDQKFQADFDGVVTEQRYLKRTRGKHNPKPLSPHTDTNTLLFLPVAAQNNTTNETATVATFRTFRICS
jgi:hypothetical protein